jgi:hypothetical protein
MQLVSLRRLNLHSAKFVIAGIALVCTIVTLFFFFRASSKQDLPDSWGNSDEVTFFPPGPSPQTIRKIETSKAQARNRLQE